RARLLPGCRSPSEWSARWPSGCSPGHFRVRSIDSSACSVPAWWPSLPASSSPSSSWLHPASSSPASACPPSPSCRPRPPSGASVFGQIMAFVVQPHSKSSLVSRTAFPTFARVQDEPERVLRATARMQRLVALGALPALGGMAAVSPRLLALWLGGQYVPYLH